MVRRYDASFTAGLLLAGALAGVALFSLLALREPRAGPPGHHPLDIVALALVLFMGAAVLPALLRAVGAGAAWRATDLGCRLLLFWFPVGTGLFAWWVLFLREREQERAPSS